MLFVKVGDQCFELVLGTIGREVGDLWLEGAGEIGGGVGDGRTELENRIRLALQMSGELRRIGVESDAQQRIVLLPGGGELFPEFSARFHFHESFSVTARLNTGVPGCESTRSATK